MIVGIGTDIVKIQRVMDACKKKNFIERYFTEHEREHGKKGMESIAGDFAVKEAVAKALGTGFTDFGPESIEVLRDKMGKPYVELKEKAQKHANHLGIKKWHVSISHEKEYAVAYVIAEE